MESETEEKSVTKVLPTMTHSHPLLPVEPTELVEPTVSTHSAETLSSMPERNATTETSSAEMDALLSVRANVVTELLTEENNVTKVIREITTERLMDADQDVSLPSVEMELPTQENNATTEPPTATSPEMLAEPTVLPHSVETE